MMTAHTAAIVGAKDLHLAILIILYRVQFLSPLLIALWAVWQAAWLAATCLPLGCLLASWLVTTWPPLT